MGDDGEGSTMVLQSIIGLVILAMVAIAFIAFAYSKLDSSAYFMEFYSKDMALLSDVVAASPGTTIVTYDNIKRALELQYTFSKGKVRVWKKIDNPEETDIPHYEYFFAAYERLKVPDATLDNPYFAVFLKQGDVLQVKEAAGYLKACTINQPSIAKEDIRLNIQSESRDILVGANEALSVIFRGQEEYTDPKNPNIEITVNQRIGAEKKVSISSFGTMPLDAQYLSCLIEKQIEAFTNGFTITTTQGKGDYRKVGVIIVVVQPEEQPLNLKILGQIIGKSVGNYAQ